MIGFLLSFFYYFRLTVVNVKRSTPIVSLFFIFGLFSDLPAQVSITLDQFKAILTPGLTHTYTNSDQTLNVVDIGKPGGPNVYDFSNVQLPAYSVSNNYYVSSVPMMISRYPSNAVTIGESPDLVERNPVFIFGQDTVFVLGEATDSTPQEYKHYIPYQIMGKFPITYGYSFSQSLTAYDTVFSSSGTVDSSYSFNVNNITTVDGYGTLKINGSQVECLRIKLDHTSLGDKEFIYMTREGIFIDIMVPSTQPDSGAVEINHMTVLISSSFTDVKDIKTETPAEYSLSQNYPNPFNPTTTINYSVPKSSFVTIKVYDVFGREIATLLNDEKKAGNYSVQLSAIRVQLASGVYFYQIRAGASAGSASFVKTKKLLLLK